MRSPSRRTVGPEPTIRSPLALAAAILLAVTLFVVVLGSLAFLWQDHSFGAGQVRSFDQQRAQAERVTPGPLEQQSAGTVAGPAFRNCEAEARRRDPSLGRELELFAELRTTEDGGVIHDVSLGRGNSPYLAACLASALEGARFPARSLTTGRVGWHLLITNGVVSVTPIASR